MFARVVLSCNLNTKANKRDRHLLDEAGLLTPHLRQNHINVVVNVNNDNPGRLGPNVFICMDDTFRHSGFGSTWKPIRYKVTVRQLIKMYTFLSILPKVSPEALMTLMPKTQHNNGITQIYGSIDLKQAYDEACITKA